MKKMPTAIYRKIICKHCLLFSVLLFFCIQYAPGQKLNVSLSKNELDLNSTDSIIYKFYLATPSITSIKFINIYGGDKIIFEENNERSKGWNELKLYSDSLNKNCSSGVYYLEIEANINNNPLFNYNSFQSPWGELISPENIYFDKSKEIISYKVPKLCMSKINIVLKNGFLLSSFNWEPNKSGIITKEWDGYDLSGSIYLLDKFNPIFHVISYGLPNSVFYLINANKPLDYTANPSYPADWQNHASYPQAKKEWNKDFVFPIDCNINVQNMAEVSIDFPSSQLNKNNIYKFFESKNEFCIALNEDLFIEQNNVDITKSYQIAFPKFNKGKHVFIINMIFFGDKTGTCIKEVIVD